MFGSLQGTLSVGASDETADTILPCLLNRIGSFYPRLTLEIKVLKHLDIVDMLKSGAIDLALTTRQTKGSDMLTLRTSPTLWYCAADYVLLRASLSRLFCWMPRIRFGKRSLRYSTPPALRGIFPMRQAQWPG